MKIINSPSTITLRNTVGRKTINSAMSDPTQPPMYREAIEWMQGIKNPFCCSTWAYTGSPYPGEDWEPPHSRWSTVLRCINEKKIVVPPPSDKQIAIAALDKATWMVQLDVGGVSTRYTYIVPSNTQDGYLMEVCRGGLTDLSGTSSALSSFGREFPDYVRIFPGRHSATHTIECEKHENKWKCWFYERQEVRNIQSSKEEAIDPLKRTGSCVEGVSEG